MSQENQSIEDNNNPFNEDQLFHKPKRLTEEEINKIKKQIPPSLLTSSDDPITKKLLS